MGTLTTYTRPVLNTFDGEAQSSRLRDTLNQIAAITPGCSHVNINGEDILIYMKDVLTPTEEGLMDDVIESHIGAQEQEIFDPLEKGMYLFEWGTLFSPVAGADTDQDLPITTIRYLDFAKVKVLNAELGDNYRIVVVDTANPGTVLKIAASGQYVDPSEPTRLHNFKGALRLDPGQTLRARYTATGSGETRNINLNLGVWSNQ